ALGVGMLVDNAIVVLESIARCREEGDPPREAALRGVREVGTAVAASTLTTVAVFFPIVFVVGIAGQVFRDLSLTVVFSLLASLAMSLFFIPMLSARQWGVSERARKGGSLRAEVFAPRHLSAGIERIRTAPGFFRKVRNLFGLPFFLALGEPLWPHERFPLRGGGESVHWKVVRKILSLLLFPFWAAIRVVAAVLAMASGIFAYLFRIFLTVGELVTLWVGGLGLWLVNKALAGPLKWFDRGFDRAVVVYKGMVRMAMNRPSRVLVSVAIAFIFLFMAYKLLDTELIPQMHNRTLEVEATLPVGTPLEDTDQTARGVAKRLMALPEVSEVAVQSGVAKDDLTKTEGGEYSARMTITLVGQGRLQALEDRALRKIRAILENVPDMRSKVRFPSLFSRRTPVEVEVYADDLDRLRALNRQAFAQLSVTPGITDLQTSLSDGNPEIQISYDRDRLSRYGLDIASVASLVRTKVLGQVQTKFDKGREKIDIRMQVGPEDRATLGGLGDLVVNPGAPHPIPLSAIANLKTGVGPSEIRRVDQQRVAVISANLEDVGLKRAADNIAASLSRLHWGPEEGYKLAGQKDEMDRSSRSLLMALVLSIFLVYLVMASQFESLLHPFLIMFSIPLALVGVLLILLVLDIPLSILVFIGMIMLAGIVVNNAIVLVDYINQLRARGMSLEESIELGGTVRMRPILMTTFTTLFGLLPLAVGAGAGSELQSPMAITVMAGLAASTLLTLLVIPTLYYLVERRRHRSRA
ncbi:MAG: efflux RND transporter permease subunit, partial [Acidobacteriota bacterium]